MNTVYSFTPAQLWTGLLAICAAIATVSGAVTIVGKWIQKAKEPNTTQDKKLADHETRISALEVHSEKDYKRLNDLSNIVETHQKRISQHEEQLTAAEHHLTRIDEANSVIMQALLALLSHGIDGNSMEPMCKAKEAVESYLIGQVGGND